MIQYFARANYVSGVFCSLLSMQLRSSAATALYRTNAVSNRPTEGENAIPKSRRVLNLTVPHILRS